MPRELICSNGKVAIVDDDDFDVLASFRWWARRCDQREDRWYAVRAGKTPNEKATVYMHRQILGASPGQYVDHADRDGLNNTRGNLRLCTRSQNQANVLGEKAASGFRGVIWDKEKRRWRAMSSLNGAVVNLGRFRRAEDAAIARDRFVRERFGSFGRYNFPREGEARA